MTLGRSEAEFWRMTPAKLHALAELHAEIMGAASATNDQPTRKPSTNPLADLTALGADL